MTFRTEETEWQDGERDDSGRVPGGQLRWFRIAHDARSHAARRPDRPLDRGVHKVNVMAKIGRDNMVRYGLPPKATYRQDNYCMAGSAELC
ncbi:hypothetical protein [Amycolatopsis sp. NPDC051071]|uniref:hypothetical protein n=1 Tax=Amycolatopsis sp. NPDC051071 TaxID=3154637 RepID=UPI0034435914